MKRKMYSDRSMLVRKLSPNYPRFGTKIIPVFLFNYQIIISLFFCPLVSRVRVESVSEVPNPTLLSNSDFTSYPRFSYLSYGILPPFFIPFLPTFSILFLPTFSILFLPPFSNHSCPHFRHQACPFFNPQPSILQQCVKVSSPVPIVRTSITVLIL